MSVNGTSSSSSSSEDEGNEEDEDIDISYDWNANAVKIQEMKTENDDEESDIDIDASYDWTQRKFLHMPSNDESYFDIDSPAMLRIQTPSFSLSPNADPNLTMISKLNLLGNRYSESMTQGGAESPISALSQNDDAIMMFPSFKPSHSAKPMNTISENTFDDEKNDSMEEDAQNCINIIDAALGEYYEIMEVNGYFDKNGKGKFVKYCLKKKITNEQIMSALDISNILDPMDCEFVDFDDSFPFKVIKDEDIDDANKENLQKMEIFTLLKYCFDNKECPYSK